MKCRGKFKFKEIIRKESGSFTNSQGENISYPASYRLKVDEKTENGIQELVFKIPDNEDYAKLVEELKACKEYSDIIIDFDVSISNNYSRITPVAIATK